MKKESFIFKKKNGMKIDGVVFRPDADGCFPTVIYSHGFASNYRELWHHGDGFADAGICCVFFDFCGGGRESRSDGDIYHTTVLTEAEDLEEVTGYVSGLPFVDTSALFLAGESMGGYVSAIVGAKSPSLFKGLILWYPGFVIPEYSRRRYEKGINRCLGIPMSPDFNLAAMSIDNSKLMEGFTGPVLLIHGSEDELVPISYSIQAEKGYKNARLITIEGAGHGFDGQDSIFARESSIAFVKEQLISE